MDTVMTVTVNATTGDITQEPADAVITAINSYGHWEGGVDRAIQRVAGAMFHGQAMQAMPLRDNQTVYARATGQHRGSFRDVLFVVDDFWQPLNNLVLTALVAAENLRLGRVTLPAIRTGAALGQMEPTAEEAVRRLGQGIRSFVASNPRNVHSIQLVVYNDPQTMRLLGRTLRQIRD